jgi:hypothetical protein
MQSCIVHPSLTNTCDRSRAETVGKSVRHPGWIIAATRLTSSLAFIDGSVTNVALSAIGKDLGGHGIGLRLARNQRGVCSRDRSHVPPRAVDWAMSNVMHRT